MMKEFGLASEIIDRDVYSRTVQRFAERSITLPTFAQLADPSTIPSDEEIRQNAFDRLVYSTVM